MNSVAKRFWASTGERLVKTFVQTFLAVWIVGGIDLNGDSAAAVVSQWSQVLAVGEKALIAGAAAVLSLVMSLLSKWAGNRNTPSALPTALDPATPPVAQP